MSIIARKKRFGDLFFYESTDFKGTYKNCTMMQNITEVGILEGETFPRVLVNLDTYEISFFEDFDDDLVPSFTLLYELNPERVPVLA